LEGPERSDQFRESIHLSMLLLLFLFQVEGRHFRCGALTSTNAFSVGVTHASDTTNEWWGESGTEEPQRVKISMKLSLDPYLGDILVSIGYALQTGMLLCTLKSKVLFE